MKKLLFFTLTTVTLFSCNKEKALDKKLSKDGVTMNYLFPTKQIFDVNELHVDGTGEFILANYGTRGYYSTDNGVGWTDFSDSKYVTAVSKKGRAIMNKNDVRYCYGKNGTITFNDQANWAEYYLDEEDNLYYVKKLTTPNELFFIPSGDNMLQNVSPANNENLNVIGVVPGGGIAFHNSSTESIDIFLSKTKTWKSYSLEGISVYPQLNKAYVGEDSKIYFGSANGFDVASENGISFISFPDSLQNQYNPGKTFIMENGTIISSLNNNGSHTYLMEYKNNEWNLFSEGEFPLNELQQNFAVAGNNFYYPGYSSGILSTGIVVYNSETNERKIIGTPQANIVPIMVEKPENSPYLVSYELFNKLLTYDNNEFTQTSIPNVKEVYQDKNGKLFMLGVNTMYTCETNLENVESNTTLFNSYTNADLEISKWKMRHLNDDSYMLIPSASSTKNIGGTGFTVTTTTSSLFTSNDGINWEFTKAINYTGYPTLIDYNGIVFYNYVYDAGNFQTENKTMRSDDRCETFVDNNSSYFQVVTSKGNIIELTIDKLRRWNGDEWSEYSFNFPSGIENRLDGSILRLSITFDDKIIITTNDGTFISEESL